MIHRALKIVRQLNELSQFELANHLSIDKRTIIELESGKKTVDSKILEQYASFFDIPISSLIFFSESLNGKEKLKISEKMRVSFGDKALSLTEWIINRHEAKKKAF